VAAGRRLLLADRVHLGLHPRLPHRPRRGRRLDRPVLRYSGLCHPPDPALPTARRQVTRMSIEEVAPKVELAALLPGAQFMDAYCLALDGQNLDARAAAI